MALRSRIADHLDSLERWRLTTFGSPEVDDEDGVTPAMVRFIGSRRFGDRLREVCEVVIVLAPTTDASAIDGIGAEAAEDQLLDDLDQVPDCYPRLIGTHVDYERSLAADSRHTYIVLAVQVLGP